MLSSPTCPKCAQRRDAEWTECPFCGVVYAKLESRPEAAGRPLLPPLPLVAAGGDAVAAMPELWPATAVDPYRPPRSAPAPPAPAADAAGMARRGTRLAARMIDTVLLIGVVAVFVLPDLARGGGALAGGAGAPVSTALVSLLIIPLLLVGAVQTYLLYRHGQTVGKKLLRVRIVCTDGGRASLTRIALLRWCVPSLLGAIPRVGPLFGLANVLLIFRADRRCLHDHVAGTKVVVA